MQFGNIGTWNEMPDDLWWYPTWNDVFMLEDFRSYSGRFLITYASYSMSHTVLRNIKDWKRLCLGNNLIWWSWWKIIIGDWNLQDRRTKTTDLPGTQDWFQAISTACTLRFYVFRTCFAKWFAETETVISNSNGVEWICNHEKLVENTLCMAQEMFKQYLLQMKFEKIDI